MKISSDSSIKAPEQFKGEFYGEQLHRILYATDASAYRELPAAVAFPADKSDVKLLVRHARELGTGLIPRAAGTSLAGQVVGNGIATDITRFMNRILEINKQKQYARVQPGVVRDELNLKLKDHGLFFAPETSTSNRATIGGMAGNNSCGANSIRYGSTRDKLLEAKAILSSGEEVVFKPLSPSEFSDKVEGKTTQSELEQNIYRHIEQLLSDDDLRTEIKKRYPDPEIKRRNHGYALDVLMECAVFGKSDKPFNFCELIAGSEGTLAFITELKLQLDPLPPENAELICVHFDSLYDSLEASVTALNHMPTAVELMDHHILDRTKDNSAQLKNRFFIQGNPEAVLVIQMEDDSEEVLNKRVETLIANLKEGGLGTHYPRVRGSDREKVWNLRKAGLGLLSNKPGDDKPAPVIEDTAVKPQDLPRYIREFNSILKKYNKECVHYAHAGAGELHLRPILNLKSAEGQRLFKEIADDIADLVKKYRGCLSGEHGDGRLRGAYIPHMTGEQIYEVFKELKKTWDPNGVFNPGKITDTPPMDSSLRYTAGQSTEQPETFLRFDREKGMVRAAEQCNGSGDCRKTELIGGTMCPTYHATRDERHTTRARANVLREVFTHYDFEEAFRSEDIKKVTDTCIGCKGCKSECPSNVDLTKLKAEFDYGYQKRNGFKLKDQLTAHFDLLLAVGSRAPELFNGVLNHKLIGGKIKKLAGSAPERSFPRLAKTTFTRWFLKNYRPPRKPVKTVYLFADVFTNYLEPEIGISTVKLLKVFNYKTVLLPHADSGRTYLSKGFLPQARKRADANVKLFSKKVSADEPLIGIEPSAILTFRDEYPDLVSEEFRPHAEELKKHVFLIEEFLAQEADAGNIPRTFFRSEPKDILVHGHCHQKSLSSSSYIKRILQIPEGFKPMNIPSGCCGMAGSFGYANENYELSMKIGSKVLFPAVENAADKIICAPGHSCRHQIKDGTGRKALHPAEILYEAVKEDLR